jgi:ParB-like chromosome segregation protein Spo0J
VISLSKIKPNPKNPRLIKDEKFKQLVQSVESFPEMMEKRPMVCVTDVDGKVYPLGGNMRLKALQHLKFKEIPESWVVLADEWTEEKRREFTVKDNIGFGEWDWEMLGNDFEQAELLECFGGLLTTTTNSGAAS